MVEILALLALTVAGALVARRNARRRRARAAIAAAMSGPFFAVPVRAPRGPQAVRRQRAPIAIERLEVAGGSR